LGKTDPFTQFYPVLPNRFYPVGKTYRANTAINPSHIESTILQKKCSTSLQLYAIAL